MMAVRILMFSGRPIAQRPFHDCALSKMCSVQPFSIVNGKVFAPKASSHTCLSKKVMN